MNITKTLAGLALFAACPQVSYAHMGESHNDDGPTTHYALDHAPIGVMGDHRHKQGEWMLSYRYMNMQMEGNRDADNKLTSDQIVTDYPSRFFGQPMQPPTLRLAPQAMEMDMHMVGAMYGLTDRVTLMGMVPFISKTMDVLTYQGMMGTNQLGTFSAQEKALGDITAAANIGLDKGDKSGFDLNFNIGLSIPIGSITETGEVLTPMNMRTQMRRPYAMQPGRGTWDLKTALTYSSRSYQKGDTPFGWGAQARARLPLAKNDEGYKFGPSGELTAWLGYQPARWASFSTRLKGVSAGKIDGISENITGPVQSADPDNYGGQTAWVLLGVNILGQSGAVRGHRLALEYGLPIYQNLNGPQMQARQSLTLGWQKAF